MTPSEFLYASYCPMWDLTDWPAEGWDEISTPSDVRRAAWELLEDFAAALDAHVAAHPGEEWADVVHERWGK